MDSVTQKRIQLLHPKLRDEVTFLVNQANAQLTKHSEVRIVQALRTIEEQNELYAQGRTKAGKKVTNAKGGQSYHNYGLACFSDDTRIFTESGLKYFYELNENDKVLTFKNDKLEFQEPKMLISNDYEGEMIHVNTRSVDLLITPNHKMVVKRKTNNQWDVNWDTVTADMLNYKHKIPTAGDTGHNTIIKPTIKTYNQNFNIDDTLNWWEFMGYWLSEGSVCGTSNETPRTHSSRYSIKISQSKNKNPEIWEKIYCCLVKLGVTFSYRGHDFIFHNKGIWEYLFKIGNSYQKYIPKEMLIADKAHLDKLYYALVDGDGSYYDNGEYFSSVSKQLSEDFLLLSILLGKSATIKNRIREKTLLPHGDYQKSECKIQYEVRTRLNTTQELRSGNGDSKINREYYKGIVYCVTTDAGAIMVERNGKISVAGNCDFALLIDDKEISWDLKKDWDGDKIADWMEVVSVFKRAGWEWGGTWKFKDNPHFQKTFGLTWKDYLKKYNSGDVIFDGNGIKYVNI